MNTRAYRDDLEFLEGAFRVLDVRIQLRQKKCDPWAVPPVPDAAPPPSLEDELVRRAEEHRRRLEAARKKQRVFSLERLSRKHKLQPFETDLLLLLLYKQFAEEPLNTTGRALLGLLATSRLEMMRMTRSLRPDARLRRHRLVRADPGANLLDASYELPPEVHAELVGHPLPEDLPDEPPRDHSYRGYLGLWFKLVQLMERRRDLACALGNTDPLGAERPLLDGDWREVARLERSIRALEKQLDQFARRWPKQVAAFPLEQVADRHSLNRAEKLILVTLLRTSLGLTDSILCWDGKKLLSVVSGSETSMIRNRQLLYSKGRLIKNDLVRRERGWPGQNFLDSEYGLTEPTIRALLGHLAEEAGAEAPGAGEMEDGLYRTSEPRFALDDVVLEPALKERIRTALLQEEHRELIFRRWGFGEVSGERGGLALLLSGPPGTGKTMLAEAVARHLGKKLFVVDYSQVQNLYVGETEKRIVQAFKQAREAQAVLVWDEADAMFYSRDSAFHSWENRDVNVLLQEIERHPGVVILTTNRKHDLDEALERRLALKLELDVPGPAERERLWRRLLPERAPLASDIDLERLARDHVATGGQIKNAVLAAARAAACRAGGKRRSATRIGMADLVAAIQEELSAGWTSRSKGKLGF